VNVNTSLLRNPRVPGQHLLLKLFPDTLGQRIQRGSILAVALNAARINFVFFGETCGGFRKDILSSRFLVTLPPVLSLLSIIPFPPQVAGLIGREVPAP